MKNLLRDLGWSPVIDVDATLLRGEVVYGDEWEPPTMYGTFYYPHPVPYKDAVSYVKGLLQSIKTKRAFVRKGTMVKIED